MVGEVGGLLWGLALLRGGKAGGGSWVAALLRCLGTFFGKDISNLKLFINFFCFI